MIQRLLLGLASCLALLLTTTAPAHAASIQLPAPPGLPKPPPLPLPDFGRIDIGKLPLPRVVFPEPVIVRPPQGRPAPSPVYMRVPPGHAKKWDRHCHRYRACGQPVYFVEEGWYQDVVVPHRREQGWDDRRDHRRDHGHRLKPHKRHGKHRD